MHAPTARHFVPRDVDMFSLQGPSSNETASDLPGVGRVLGNAFSYLGRELERRLEYLAVRRGHGPQNVVLRIRKRDHAYRDEDNDYIRKYSTSDAEKQKKDLKQLIGYTRSGYACELLHTAEITRQIQSRNYEEASARPHL